MLNQLFKDILQHQGQMTRQQFADYLATVQRFCKTLNHGSDDGNCAEIAQFNDFLDGLLQEYKSYLSEMQVPVFDPACVVEGQICILEVIASLGD